MTYSVLKGAMLTTTSSDVQVRPKQCPKTSPSSYSEIFNASVILWKNEMSRTANFSAHAVNSVRLHLISIDS